MARRALELPQIGRFEPFDAEFSIKQIRRNLSRKENLLEYFISTDQNGLKSVFIFVVTRTESHIFQRPLDDSFYVDLDVVSHYLHEFNPFSESHERYDSLKTSLYAIYEQLIKPVESVLKGKNLVIVPDEELAYLPFDALLSEYHPESILNYAGLDYLLKKYNITYLSNSLLIKKDQGASILFPTMDALVPDYKGLENADSQILKGAREEVEKLLEIVKGKSIHGNPDKNMVKGIMEDAEILHLAMHARSGTDAKGSPYFLLKANDSTQLDNRLFDYEINAMSITSPMVVLSSCRTGGGELELGEGIISLSRSFLLAGAESGIHTLWPVEDSRGPDLMLDFYRDLKQGRSKGRALSTAKKNYLINTPPSYTHPYYWAAYQVTGNPAPLRKLWKIAGLLVLILTITVGTSYFIRRSFRTRL